MVGTPIASVVAAAAVAGALAGAAASSRRFGWPKDQPRRGAGRGKAAVTETVTAESSSDMVSPFVGVSEEIIAEEGSETHDEGHANSEQKPTLPLTLDNVEHVLDEVRPYLRSDGGDCKVIEIEGSVVKLELQGACSSCSASSVTLKMGIEKTLQERFPDISEVIAISPDEEALTEFAIEEVLNGIRPFLSVSNGTIELTELVAEDPSPRVVLSMKGPPLKSMAVKVEITNRIKRRFPSLLNIEIVAGQDINELPMSA
jgi:lysyl-tRNA synthetase class 2